MPRLLLALTAFLLITDWCNAQQPGEERLVYPIIPHVGGVVPLPQAVDQPRAGARMVIDVTAEAPPEEVHRGFKRAALVLNLYGAAGLQASDVTITVVLHGKATRCLLSDPAFADRYMVASNPNLPVIRDLQAAGVEVLVCGQALNYSGFAESDVAAGVTTALSAVTVVVNRQRDGYAYIPVH